MTDVTVTGEMIEKALLAGMYARAEHDGIPAERVKDAIHAYGFDNGDLAFTRAALEAALPLMVAGERARCIEAAKRVAARFEEINQPNGGIACYNVIAAIRADTGGETR